MSRTFQVHLSITIVVQISSEICITVSNYPPISFHSSPWSIATIKRPLKRTYPIKSVCLRQLCKYFCDFYGYNDTPTISRARFFFSPDPVNRKQLNVVRHVAPSLAGVRSRKSWEKRLIRAGHNRHYLFLFSPCTENGKGDYHNHLSRLREQKDTGAIEKSVNALITTKINGVKRNIR